MEGKWFWGRGYGYLVDFLFKVSGEGKKVLKKVVLSGFFVLSEEGRCLVFLGNCIVR